MKIKSLLVSAALVAAPFTSLFVAMPAHASIKDKINEQLTPITSDAGYGAADDNALQTTLGTLISTFLGLLGVVFLLLTIYAGWLWMTAQGDPKKVEKAQTLLTQAVIGLVILLSAYAISSFVITQLTSATSTG